MREPAHPFLRHTFAGSTTSGSGTTSTSLAASSSTSTASTPSSSNGAVHEQVPFLNGAIALVTVFWAVPLSCDYARLSIFNIWHSFSFFFFSHMQPTLLLGGVNFR